MISAIGLTLFEHDNNYTYRKMKLNANQIAVKLVRAKSIIYEK